MGNIYDSSGKLVTTSTNNGPGFLDKIFQGFNNLNRKAISVVYSYISPFLIDKPVFNTWDTETAVKEGLMSSHVVYACVRLRAWSAASVPWIVEEKTKSGRWVRVQDHPLENLIEHPNEDMERVDLISRISMLLDVCGNALIYKTLFKGAVMELIPIQPDQIKPIPSNKNIIQSYQFFKKGEGKTTNKDPKNIIKKEHIIHWMFPNPINPFWGLGPLQTVGRIVDTEVEAIKFQKNSLENKAVKDGILSVKRHLSKAQWTLLHDEFKAQISGPNNARGPIVLGEDVHYQPFSMTPAELDFANSRKMNREDIAIALGVPPPLIGILENSSYANSSEARIIFWLDTMIPHLEFIAAGFNRSLVPNFGDKEKLRVNYDLSQVPAMGDAFDRSATTARKLFEIGYPTNIISNRLQMGLPEIPGGNNSYIPGNLMVPADIKTYGDREKEEVKPGPEPNVEEEGTKKPPTKKPKKRAVND